MFRATALVIGLVKNLFRKLKCDHLKFNSYVNEKEIYEAKGDWVKANQLRLLKIDHCKHLLKRFSLIFYNENITRCYGRLENETKYKHPVTLSRNHN